MDKIEYRAVIKFLTKKKLSPKAIKEELDSVYHESAPSYSTVKYWSSRFLRGQESLEDDPRSGGPSTAVTEENIKLVEEIVLSDRRLKTKEIAAQVGISKTSVLTILHEHLKLRKISARWVPKLLSSIEKRRRVECCQQFLELCGQDESHIIDRIVTGDETMILYYDPTSKRESMEWRRPDEPRPKKAKVSKSAKKVMATIFWDSQGILLIDYKERNTVVNGEYYASLLHKLRAAIKEKRRGKLSKGVLLLHDNAPVHTAGVAKAAIRDCGFTEIDHPPYSPDLAPSDYYLFSKLKADLRGRKFNADEEIQEAVNDHFEAKDSEYFFNGIQALISRCKKCIEIKGDYIEK